MLNFESWIDYFLFFIIIVKIVFVISAIGHLFLSHSSSDKAKQIDPHLVHLKKRTEFIFIISMAILLIYHFNPPFPHKSIDRETALLFFLFGCVLILTSDWNLFIREAPWYKQIVNIIT
jgi:cell division protein FtsW (lipid II flippase)